MMEQEDSKINLKDDPISDGGENSTPLSSEHTVISFVIKKEDHDYPLAHQDWVKREHANSRTEHKVISFVVKEEEELFPLDHQNSEMVTCSPISRDTVLRSTSELLNPEDYPVKQGLPAISEIDKEVLPCSEARDTSRTLNTCELSQDIYTQSYHKNRKEIGQTDTLIRNQQIHAGEAPYTCTECGKVFRKKACFICHQRVHIGEKPYLCTECGKSFSDNSNFIRHQRTHTGAKPYKCDNCGKRFRQMAHLTVHERVHTGAKPYMCIVCGKCFSHDSSLLKHKIMHMGDKPFKCTDCNKSFSQKGNLIVHRRTHTGERPYPCTKCAKRFIVKRHLIKHQQTHKDTGTPLPHVPDSNLDPEDGVRWM